MRKKILVKEAGVFDFFKSFFVAKSKGTESGWLQRLREKNPKLADAWKDYDDAISKSMSTQKKVLQSRGLDTTHIDDYMKKYGIK